MSQTTISLMGESYTINLDDDDVETLQQSARLYDKYLSEMQQQSNLVSSNKIALMAGLNMAREFVTKQNSGGDSQTTLDSIKRLSDKIDNEMDRFVPDQLRQKTWFNSFPNYQ